MGYKESLDKNYQMAEARKLVTKIEINTEAFFKKEIGSKKLRQNIKELEAIINYVAVCLFKEK